MPPFEGGDAPTDLEDELSPPKGGFGLGAALLLLLLLLVLAVLGASYFSHGTFDPRPLLDSILGKTVQD